jgi:hypothetical protein
VVLKGVAPQSTITAYTVGQALITTAWSVGFGLTMLATQIGWKQTRGLIHVKKKKKKKKDGEDDLLADGPVVDAAVADTGPPDATG